MLGKGCQFIASLALQHTQCVQCWGTYHTLEPAEAYIWLQVLYTALLCLLPGWLDCS